MTEGHDEVDEQLTDDGRDDSRDQERSSQNDWSPWPGERDAESHQEPTGPAPDSPQTHSQTERGGNRTNSHQQVSAGGTRTTESSPESEGGVAITDAARGDGEWIDLGEQRPRGEALAAGDLTEEEILEYTTDRRSLSPLVQIHWGIRVTVGALIAGGVASWGLGAVGYSSQVGGAVVGLLVIVGLVWVALYYRLWVYQVRADAIYLERGVVTHVRSLVPYVRIQHVDTSQSPIERMLGLSTLVVYTAGSRGADVSIPGLLPDEARDLQRRVKELAIEAEGDDAL